MVRECGNRGASLFLPRVRYHPFPYDGCTSPPPTRPFAVIPGRGLQGLVLGDTVGRTPGAYGFVVSCDLLGFVAEGQQVLGASLVLTRNGGTSLHPLSKDWWYPGGKGAATLQTAMVGVGVGLALRPPCFPFRPRFDHTDTAALTRPAPCTLSPPPVHRARSPSSTGPQVW
jgi:hypothetical protein